MNDAGISMIGTIRGWKVLAGFCRSPLFFLDGLAEEQAGWVREHQATEAVPATLRRGLFTGKRGKR